MKRASRLVNWATDIYVDQARRFGYQLVPDHPQIEAIVNRIARDAFEPLPDPAALVVAARLLHDLVTTRRRIPINAGPAWALVETYLLLHQRTITARDDEIRSLLASLHQESIDAVSTLRHLDAMAEPRQTVQ